MRLAHLIVLTLLLFLITPAFAIEINPSVEKQPFFCRYSFTKWSPLCQQENTNQGNGADLFQNITINWTTFVNGTYGDNSFFNATEIYFENITMQNFTINGNVLYYSLMNQTPNMTAGPQGPQGEQGIQGIQGLQGVNGTPGEPGPQGIQGVNGTPGSPGAQGDQGIPGPQGDPGPAGPMGPANMTAGPQGPQGEKGDKGDKGDTGDVGPVGPMNMTANMTAGPMNQTPNMTASNLDTSWNLTYALLSGGRVYTGKMNHGGFNVSNVSDPVTAQDAATKNYVDAKSVSDGTAYVFINGTRSMTGPLNTTSIRLSDVVADLSTTSNSSRLRISSGALNTYGGASINLFGKDSGVFPGWTLIRTDDGSEGYVDTITISGHTKTPSISVNGWNITNIKTVVGPDDAANKSYVDAATQNVWVDWSPTYTYTGTTPTGVQSTARYMKMNKTVFINTRLYASDSKGATINKFTLPINCSQRSALYSNLYYGSGLGTQKNPGAEVYNTDALANVVYFDYPAAGTNGQPMMVMVSGTYESV